MRTTWKTCRSALAVMALATALPLLSSAPALAAPAFATPAGDAATRAARVCQETMGLTPANTDFAACVDSLKQSRAQMLADSGEAVALTAARKACSGETTRSGYATCVLDRTENATQQTAELTTEQGN